MNRQLSSETVRGMAASETDIVLLHLLTVYVDGEAVLRLVDNKEPITSKGTGYLPWAFSVILPQQDGSGTNKSCKLSIDNSDISLFAAIKEAAAVAREITADVAVILSHTPNVYEQGPLSFILRNVTADKNAITGELYDFYLYDRKATAFTYSPKDFPGLFF